MDLELHQLDRRYEALRTTSRERDSRVLASLARDGQQLPVVVVAAAETNRYVLVDGYKRVRGLNKIDGPPGFFLATDATAAEFFALRRAPGGVVQFNLTSGAVRQLEAAGARIGPIPRGGFPGQLPGNEFAVPTNAFELFNALRSQGAITVIGRYHRA